MTSPLLRALERHGRGGVFLLTGDDAFRRDEGAREVVEAHLEAATRDFNYDLLRGPELQVDQLASVLATPPMMAEWRVVLVRDAEALSSSKHMRDLVLATAESPPPGLALVLVASIGGSSARFWKDLRKAARSVDFPAVGEDDVPGWVMERASQVHGREIEEDAARALGAAIGVDLGVLARELEKLTDYAEGDRPITRADVEAAGIQLPTQDRWKWFDLVSEKRFDEALSTLPVLMAQGESGVGLVIGLTSQILRLGAALGAGPDAVASVLPPNQRWLARKAAQQARRWTMDELEDAVLGLLRADRLLKSSGVGDEAIVEEWLLARLARSREAA